MFVGQAEADIDSKGRLAIPAKFLAEIRKQGGAVYALPVPGGIRLIPIPVFERAMGGMEPSLIPDDDSLEVQGAVFSMAERLELDSAGRVAIPENMRLLAGLDSGVVVVGAATYIVAHDRTHWRAIEQERLSNLPDMVEKLDQLTEDSDTAPSHGSEHAPSHTLEIIVSTDVAAETLVDVLQELSSLYSELSNGDRLVIIDGRPLTPAESKVLA